MITINLLPSEKNPISLYIKKALLFFLIIITSLITSTLICQKKINTLSDTLAKIKKDIVSYNKVIYEIKDIKKKQKNIITRTNIIKNLASDKLTAISLLNFISDNVIAQRMWFTNLIINKNTVNIQGIAIDNKTAADFMKQLETGGYFSTVHLKKLKRSELYQDLHLKNFQIHCSIKKDGKKKNS